MGSHMKTTIEIADPLMKEVRTLAADRGQTLREVVETALRKLIEENRRRRRTFRLADRSVGGKGLQSGLSYDDWSTILDLSYGDRA